MRRFAVAALLGLAGCASSWADMGGSMGGTPFEHPRAVAWGGSFLVFLEEKAECDELGWVRRSYVEGVRPDLMPDIAALQVHARDGLAPGTYDLGSGGTVKVDGLVSTGTDFEVHHGRAGTLVLDEADENGASGTISVSFAQDGIAGEFLAEHCASLEQ